MPLDMDDADGDGFTARGRVRKFSEDPHRPWWRPASSLGRVSLAAGALFVVTVMAVSAFATKRFFERDSRFRIAGTSNIQATGLAELNRSEMLPVFGEDVGRNIFFVPLSERRKQLEEIPWVERATVMRLLPDQIRVAIVERQPVAFVRQGQQIGLVDSNGVLLTMPASTMAKHNYSFPVVTGIDGRDPIGSRKTRMAVYQRLLGELDANGQHLSDQLSEIDLTDPEDARILMPEQGTDILAHFGEDRFLERYQRYKAHIAEWRQQYPKLAEVDLRYDQQVVLQMTPGSNATPASVNATDGKPEKAEAQKPIVEKPKAKPATAKAEAPKHAQASKPAKAHTAKPSTKSKSAKNKSAQKKKRAEANRAAMNVTKPKSAAKPHPAAPVGLGQ
jgi:cell division protein FtsQ